MKVPYGDKKQRTGRIVKLGDGEGQVQEFEGILVDIDANNFYPEQLQYNFKTSEGELISIPGNAMIDSNLDMADIGSLVKINFTGWQQSKAGRAVKGFDVYAYNGLATAEIKKSWPLYGTIKPKSGKASDLRAKRTDDDDDPTPVTPKRKASTGTVNIGGEDFDKLPGALDDDDDELPF